MKSVLTGSALIFCALLPSVRAESLPPGFVLKPIGSGFDLPVDLAFLDAGRMLVAEKSGRVWLVEGDATRNLVLDLSAETLTSGDRGLLALEADPAFAANGWVYVLYVVDPVDNGADDEVAAWSRLARFTTAFDGAGDLHVVPGSKVDLIGGSWPTGIPSCHLSHAIGSLAFLGDGSLVLATGDGASYDRADGGGVTPDCFGPGQLDPAEDVGAFRSQEIASLSGKVLRIDPVTGLGLADNPFFSGDPSDVASRVFALGLRNPFRLAAIPDASAGPALLVADVGWDRYEELDVARGGENFGWPCSEGSEVQGAYATLPGAATCGASGVPTGPLVAIDHSDSIALGFTSNCLAGVAFPDAAEYPPLYSKRVYFCDFALGWIRTAQVTEDPATGAWTIGAFESFASGLRGPINLERDPSTGELVLIELETNTVSRLRYLGSNVPPVIVADVTPRYGPLPLVVDAQASASYSPSGSALTYRWKFGDGESAYEPDLTKSFTQEGSFLVKLIVTDEALHASLEEFLVTPGNLPPSASILAPVGGSTYHQGDLVTLQGQASDAEDGASGTPLVETWKVVIVHDHHVHPDFANFDGPSGSFHFDGHANGTFLEARYTVTDSHGLTTTATVPLYAADSEPRAHIVSVSDATPRVGQAVTAIGHVHHPGDVGGAADLVWDWGDGTQSVYPASSHQIDTAPTHAYAQPQAYTITLSAILGGATHSVTQSISVVAARPALAIFTPLVGGTTIPWAEQQALADALAASVASTGSEVEVFRFDEQAALTAWMLPYVGDGVRDVLLVFDAAPGAAYAGEDEGALLEQWLEQGDAIVWTGAEPFAAYATTTGALESEGASASDLFDAGGDDVCAGSGYQILNWRAPALPGLVNFVADHALRYKTLEPAWAAGPIYAAGADQASDAIVVTNAAGGFYAQFFCTAADGVPRLAVLDAFLRSRL